MTASTLSLQLGDLVCDEDTEDDDGIVWGVTSIVGWYDSTQVRTATQEREPVGEVQTVARENARAIVVNLDAKLPGVAAPLGDLVFNAIETVKRAGRSLYVPSMLTVTDPVRATQAMVRRSGSVHTAILGDKVVLQAQIPLLASDPRRFATSPATDDVTLTGSATTVSAHLTVGGEVPTPAVYTLKGPATNPKLLSHEWGTSATRPFVQWIGDLPDASHEIVVDTATGVVTHDGVAAVLAAGSVLFELVAGDNLLTYSRSARTGTAAATADWSDAYD